MTALSDDERPSELVAAARAFLDEPSILDFVLLGDDHLAVIKQRWAHANNLTQWRP